MSSTYPIKGIPLAPGQPLPTRKEITAWYSNDENALQVSLFIQALALFQKMPATDQLSYFRVAGIHGFPLVSWDGVTDPKGWYCSHQQPTFPTWHRPYVALYEQRLYEIMLEIIDKIPEDQKRRGNSLQVNGASLIGIGQLCSPISTTMAYQKSSPCRTSTLFYQTRTSKKSQFPILFGNSQIRAVYPWGIALWGSLPFKHMTAFLYTKTSLL